jgi:hypothetical protein
MVMSVPDKNVWVLHRVQWRDDTCFAVAFVLAQTMTDVLC